MAASCCGRAGERPPWPAGAAQIGQALDDGSARDAFQAMLRAQGVPAEVSRLLCEGTEAQRLQVLKLAGNQEELRALQDGTVQQIQAMPIAQVLHELGAGRTQAGQCINPRVGAELLVSTGKRVSKGNGRGSLEPKKGLGQRQGHLRPRQKAEPLP
ncbi:hypothetical protein Chor_008155 [Crotalus horridus]